MEPWRASLPRDPLPPLLSSGIPALEYFARRDLAGEPVGPVSCLWELPGALKILKKQQPGGSWLRSGENKHPAVNPHLIETWRWLRILVDQYGFDRAHPRIGLAVEYLFSCQNPAGDFRGILANQYATYYMGAILATLIQVGYAQDPRTEKGLHWLLSMRQDDGGWTIPLLTHRFSRKEQYRLTTELAGPVEPDRSKPFSHHWTGMVLRAFAVHPRGAELPGIRRAAGLLVSRFFQPDAYASYHSPAYWVRFEYPFWWNNLVAALDTVSRLGFTWEDGQVQAALSWLASHQEPSGLWRVTYAKEIEPGSARSREMKYWVSLAVCRVFKRLAPAGTR